MPIETEILYDCIAMNHNGKIIDDALNALKQFSKDGTIYLYDKDGNSFKITEDTDVFYYRVCKIK